MGAEMDPSPTALGPTLPYNAPLSSPLLQCDECPCTTSQLLRAAKFMSEDSDRRVFRRFDELRVFVLLRLQHRLAAMTTRLDELRLEQEARTKKGITDEGKDEVLNRLAADVGGVLRDYDDTFWAQARFEGLRGPSANFTSDFLEHSGIEYPVLPKDLGATDLEPVRLTTLASTAAREKSAAHRFVDKHEFLQQLFAVKTKHGKRGKRPSAVFIYSESAISRVERTIVHVSFCILLLCPIIALSLIQSAVGKLAIVIGFLLLAAFLTSGILTGANNAGLAVLAGYGAILIFFLGVKLDFSN